MTKDGGIGGWPRDTFRLPTRPLYLAHYILCSHYLCVCAKSPQLCPTLCSPMDYSPPGSSVCGICQARILEWVAEFPPPGDLPSLGSDPSLFTTLAPPGLTAQSSIAIHSPDFAGGGGVSYTGTANYTDVYRVLQVHHHTPRGQKRTLQRNRCTIFKEKGPLCFVIRSLIYEVCWAFFPSPTLLAPF